MSHERVAPHPSRNASEARGGRRCAPCGVWAVRACGARERERRAAERAEAGRGGRQRSGEGRGQQRESTGQRDSIADGTALRCGRVGSRHFRSPRGFVPRGLFVYVATRHRRSVLPLSEGAASAEDGNSPPSTLPAFYLSVKKKKILRSKDTDVRFTELLIGGGGKKKIPI